MQICQVAYQTSKGLPDFFLHHDPHQVVVQVRAEAKPRAIQDFKI